MTDKTKALQQVGLKFACDRCGEPLKSSASPRDIDAIFKLLLCDRCQRRTRKER